MEVWRRARNGCWTMIVNPHHVCERSKVSQQGGPPGSVTTVAGGVISLAVCQTERMGAPTPTLTKLIPMTVHRTCTVKS